MSLLQSNYHLLINRHIKCVLLRYYHYVCVWNYTFKFFSGEQLFHGTINREDTACLDIKIHGFWGTWQHFNISFLPYYPSCQGLHMAVCYRNHEGEKCCAYKQKVHKVEQSKFTPLVFSTSGGMGRSATGKRVRAK